MSKENEIQSGRVSPWWPLDKLRSSRKTRKPDTYRALC